jgi:hypothetical protein
MYCVNSIYHTSELLRTFDDVYDSWAKKISGDGLAGTNFSEPCHHIVGFVDRAVLIQPVDLQMFVVFVHDALEASLRSFDVLKCDDSYQRFVLLKVKNVLCEAC